MAAPRVFKCCADHSFRDVLIVDATIISLYQDARNVYAPDDDRAGVKLHLIESLSAGLPTRFQTTDASTDGRSQLPTGEWVAGALILFDFGYYDFWLFDRIDANDGWFISRIKRRRFRNRRRTPYVAREQHSAGRAVATDRPRRPAATKN